MPENKYFMGISYRYRSMNDATFGYAHWILSDNVDAPKKNLVATAIVVFDFELFIGVILDG